jgi:short-subunit dehydrogenase
LHAEVANTSVRVSGLRPGPMRTPLRAKAYVDDGDGKARDPSAYAEACVALLSADGVLQRGKIFQP